MTVTVRELAALVQGTLHGDGGLLITEARSFANAEAGHITFLEPGRLARCIPACRASALVVGSGGAISTQACIEVNDPLGAFVAVVQHLRGKELPLDEGVDPRAIVHPTAVLGPNCSIQPLATIGAGSVLGARCRVYPGAVVGRNCKLGDDVVLHPHAVLYDGTTVGHRVIVHASAVLGADGFGYRMHQGRHVKVPQLGNLVIGDDVEIGAGTTLDRGTIDATSVGAGTKIDNLVQIAHNCQIGPHNLLASQVGIAGSSSTGAYVVLAGQAGVADHIHIGDQTILGAQSGVTHDLAGGGRYFGAPATPEREQKRMLAVLFKLPEMRQDLQRIKKHLGLKDEAAA